MLDFLVDRAWINIHPLRYRMLIKGREMFVKEEMIFINWQKPIELSRIIGGGEPLKTFNELGSSC